MNTDKKIRTEITRLAKHIFAGREASVFLYGSRARGDARKDSDWDLLILTNQELDNNDFDRYAFPFAELGWHYGAQITPLLYSRSQWLAEKDTAFYNAVQSEAIQL